MKNIKIADGAQYGYAILKDNSKQPLAIISKDIFDITQKLNHQKVVTQWVKHTNNIFLTIYWTNKKRGLVFHFSMNDSKLIKDIIRKQSLAISNSGEKGKILVVDVKKDEPLKWLQ